MVSRCFIKKEPGSHATVAQEKCLFSFSWNPRAGPSSYGEIFLLMAGQIKEEEKGKCGKGGAQKAEKNKHTSWVLIL